MAVSFHLFSSQGQNAVRGRWYNLLWRMLLKYSGSQGVVFSILHLELMKRSNQYVFSPLCIGFKTGSAVKARKWSALSADGRGERLGTSG